MSLSKLFFLVGIFTLNTSNAQEHGFEFGKVDAPSLSRQVYPLDTTATAIVLNEFGEAYIDNDNHHNLIFEYHIKIKILRKEGLKEADYKIPLHIQNISKESILLVKASSFNLLENGQVQESKLQQKLIFTQQLNKYTDVVKFAIPSVREGSIIEIFYKLESPFLYNFRSWSFQSNLPKLTSEYWALIPGNYHYNILLRGYLPLEKSENEILKDCFSPGNGRLADCVQYKYAMTNVPAFKEENYMTAASNYLSAVHFELEEIFYFDGRKDKISKEWKDVEDELRHSEIFGLQIKRAQNFIGDRLDTLVATENDPYKKAKKIYTFIRNSLEWNGVYGMFSEVGIKKALESGKGNVGDINLALIAALKYAKLPVETVILSTRSNGEVVDLFPVISDFNYVIAKVTLNDKVYLLDATDNFLPFGMIPTQCLNGKGRVFGEEGSYWHEIKVSQKEKLISNYTFELQNDGSIKGTIQLTYLGYEAVKHRKKIYQFNTEKEYIVDLQNTLNALQIRKHELQNLANEDNALVEKFDVLIEANNFDLENILFYPFILSAWKKNPFPSESRLYPVDFGAPLEEATMITFFYPPGYTLNELPKNVSLSLPNTGGRLIFNTQLNEKSIKLNYNLAISKSKFSAEEYSYLRELFNIVVNLQNSPFLFMLKK